MPQSLVIKSRQLRRFLQRIGNATLLILCGIASSTNGRQPRGWRCTRFRLSVCLCHVCNQLLLARQKQTNVQIYAKFTADTPYTLTWTNYFRADNVQNDRLSAILISLTKRRTYQSHSSGALIGGWWAPLWMVFQLERVIQCAANKSSLSGIFLQFSQQRLEISVVIIYVHHSLIAFNCWKLS